MDISRKEKGGISILWFFISLFCLTASFGYGQTRPNPNAPNAIQEMYQVGAIWEEFAQPDVLRFWNFKGGLWGIENDGITSYLKQKDIEFAGNTVALVANRQFGDIVAEVKVNIPMRIPDPILDSEKGIVEDFRKKIGAGIIFGYIDDSNYYMFRIAGTDGLVLGKLVDGKWIDLANPRSWDVFGGTRFEFGADKWYALKVTVKNRTIECRVSYGTIQPSQMGKENIEKINYVLVAKVSEAPLMGKVGVTTFDSTANFREFRLVEFQ
jgi:hypothetical protein